MDKQLSKKKKKKFNTVKVNFVTSLIMSLSRKSLKTIKHDNY